MCSVQWKSSTFCSDGVMALATLAGRNDAGTYLQKTTHALRSSTERPNLQFPLLLNDSKGNWKVQVRDVISGLTAEQIVRR